MNTEPHELRAGQDFHTSTGLIYTVRGPDPDVACFCNEHGVSAPVHQFATQYPGFVMAAIPPGLVTLSAAKWTASSMKAFETGARVDAYKLYEQLVAYLKRFFVAPTAVIDLCATFVMLTYVFTIGQTVPYLHILGEPGTGKSLLADLLETLSFAPRQASSISAAAIYRLLDAAPGTLIIDEQGAGDPKWHIVLRAGYRKSGAVTVCESTMPVTWRCFGPKVIITNDPLNDAALATRTVPIVLERTAQKAERFTALNSAVPAAQLRDDLHIFGLTDARDVYSEYLKLDSIDGISHRDADLAAPLLAVAAVIDGSSSQPTSCLGSRLLDLFQSTASARRATDRVWNERAAFARCILQFIADGASSGARSLRWGDHDDWYLAADFAADANKSGELERPLSAKDIGERLNRHRLILERRVLDVPHQRGVVDPKAHRAQKVAYRFDVERARKSAGGAP